MKQKYNKKAKLHYMNTDSFIEYIKTDDIYKNIAEDGKTRFGTSNYELECDCIDRPLPRGENGKSNWINKRWIRWKKYDKICWTKTKILQLLNRWL